MKRIVLSVISFIIFIFEVIIQFYFILNDTLKKCLYIISKGIIRYHNRIQLWTSKKNFIIIEEYNT